MNKGPSVRCAFCNRTLKHGSERYSVNLEPMQSHRSYKLWLCKREYVALESAAENSRKIIAMQAQ